MFLEYLGKADAGVVTYVQITGLTTCRPAQLGSAARSVQLT